MEFRDALKLFRSEVGIAQIDIAEALHINISTVARWEQGKTSPNRSTATKLQDYAKSKCASSECLENLKNALNKRAKEKLFNNRNSLYTVEHSTISRLIEDAAFPIFVSDFETNEILYVNRATEQQMGKNAGEIIGKKCYECIMRRDKPCDFCHENQLIKNGSGVYEACWPFDGKTCHAQKKLIQWNGHNAQVRYAPGIELSQKGKPTDTNNTADAVIPDSTTADSISAASHFLQDMDNKKSLEQLKLIFENINGGVSIVVFEDNGAVRLAYANERYYKLFGYTKEQLEKELKGSHSLVYPDDGDKAAAAITKVKETKQPVIFRYRIIKRDKSIAHVRCSSSVTAIDGISGYVLISILTDITESVQVEQKALVAGQRLDAIMKNMNSAVTASIIKKDGTVEILFSNELHYEMLGYTREQYLSEVHDPLDPVYPDDLADVRDAIYSLKRIGEEKEMQYRIFTRDGRLKTIRMHISMMNFPDVSEPVQLAIHADVTSIVEAQEKLAAQHEQIAELLNDTPSGIAIIEVDPKDMAGTLHTVYYNDRFISYSGYARDEYDARLRNNELSYVFDEDAPKLISDTANICRGEIGASADTTVRCHTKDGGFRWLLFTGQLTARRGNICVINISIVDITQRKEAIDRQRISEEMLRIAAETDQRSMIVYDVKNNTCRAESRTLFSAKYGEVFENIPQSLIDMGLTAPDSVNELCSLFARIREGDKKISVSLQLRSGPDKYEWFECNVSTVFDTEGQPDHAVLVFHNITEQRIKEAVFKKWQQSINARPAESYTLFRCNLTKDASLDQQDGELLKISFPADAMSFNSRTELYADEFVYQEDRETYIKLLDSDVLLAMFYRGEHFTTLDYRETAANGEPVWRRLTIELVEYPNSTDVQAFLMYEDIDVKKKAEIEAMELAKSDPLTGALNRSAFAEAVDALIHENPSSSGALIMLDMDGFKEINDTFGHSAGDQALQEVVAVLRSYARKGDLVCRLGGDEFMIWLRDIPYDAVIAKTAQQMCEHIRKAYSQEVLLSASAGIAVYPRDGQSYDDLYPNADKALYKVKQSGKGAYAFFSAIKEEQTAELTKAVAGVKPSPKSQRNSKRRMLIVDDNEINRLMLMSIFKDEYFIETAKNGGEAMIRLRHFKDSISVVLLDLIMPGVDGFAVLKRMQNDVDLRAIPVVVVTGDENHETLLKAFDLGAAEFVTKPVDVDIIRIRVKAVISKAENERLRAQNSYLMLQRDEEVKYRTVLESTGTVVIEYDWRNHVFIYDGEITKYIAGNFNHRGLWQIFLSDMVADSSDVKVLQDTLLNLGSSRERDRNSKLVMLKTPKDIKHWFRVNFYKSVDDFGLADKLIITFNDVHEEVLANDKLLFQATRDELTGLYNRTAFLEKAAELIAAREPGYYVMACIDVEKFKVVNDRYGTEKGDEVLRHIAVSIGGFVDKNAGICCRLASDKFAALYPAKLLGTPELEENHTLVSSPACIPRPLRLCVGRCMVNDTSLSVSALFDRAAIAEATAKGRYDTFIVDYDESMRDSILKEQQIALDMVDALKNEEFEPWFQPQYNHATGALIGAEALVRWRKNGKIIPPNDFIPVFERNGFIYEVDQFIWRSVCILLRRWLDEGKKPLPISVNISRFDLLQTDFMDKICALTEEYKLPPDLLRLEVTESAFSEATSTIYAVVNGLIDKGFTVEIDDFGSGYSSLNTLKDVPASILKLDMRFFERSGDAKRGGNIVESVVRMAKWLGMAVIAEGVEDKAQADYLKSIGCFYIQGYLYARPMPTDEYEKLQDAGAKEAQLTRLQTLQNLDNNDFWDSHSIDTLIFNSYVGAACILEFHNGKVEMLRATDHYARMLSGGTLGIKDVLTINWMAHMDDHNVGIFTNAVSESLGTKETVTCELEFHGLPGCPEIVILRSTLRVIATVGERHLIYCLSDNMTAQRAAEREALNASERINAVMNNSHCGISAVIARPDGTVELLFVNNRFFELLGYTREQYEAEVKSPYDLILPEDRERTIETVTKLTDIGGTVSLEVRELRRDGSVVWLRSDISLVRFANVSEPVQIASFLDITEQKENEMKQLESARQLEVIMSNVNGGVSAIQILDDATSNFVFNNDRYYELYGYTREEALAQNLDVMSLILPEDLPFVMEKVRQLKKDHQPCVIDYRITKKDGSHAMLRVNASLMSISGYGDDVITSVVTDITERKSIEERLDAIVANINGGISAVYLNKDNPEYVLANEQYYRILGYTKEEFESERVNPFDLLHPDDRERVEKKFADMQKYGERYTMEYRIIRRDGAVRNILCNTSVLKLFGIDEPLQLAVSNDVTELRETQRQELAVKNRLDTVMDAMANGITAVSVKGHIQLLFANDRFYQIHGVDPENSAENAVRKTFSMIHADDRKRVRDIIMSATDVGQSIETEYRVSLGKGIIRYIKMSITTTNLIGVDDTVQVAVYSDITDEKEATDQLRFLNNSARDILDQSDSEQAIRDTLSNLMAYFAADRGYVIELDEGRMVSSNTYEVCADGITPEIENLQALPYTVSDYWYETLSRNEYFVVEDVSDLTDRQMALRELLISQDISSMVLAPLFRDGRLIGFAGVDNPKQGLYQLEQLRVLSHYIAILMTRRDLIRKITHDSEMIQQLMDDTPGGFLRMRILPDNTPVIVSLNEGFSRLLGMTSKEVMAKYGDDAHKCVVAEDYTAIKDAAVQTLAGDGKYTYKCRLKKKDGTIIWVQVIGRYVQDENGELFRNSYFTDITDEVTAEENQKTLLDNLPFGAAMYEFDGKGMKALHINRQYQIMVGRDRNSENLEGYSPVDFIHPDDRAVTLNAIKDAIAGRRDACCNIRILYGEDEYRSFHIDARIMAQPDGNYLVYAAYTRLSEQELTFENALPHMFSTIMESSTDLAFAKDVNYRYICCSKTLANLLGLDSEDEVVGKTDYELFPKEIADMFRRDDSALFATERPQIDIEEIIPSPDGTKHYIRTSKHLLRNNTDAVIGIYCTGRDITEVQEAYARLRLLTDSIPGGIATFRCSPGKVEALYYNDGVCELSGYSREEYDANPVQMLDLIFAEDRPIISKHLQLMQSGEKHFSFTVRIHTKDGGYKWITGITTVTDSIGEVYSVNTVLTDVTEQQEEKERLRMAEEEYRIATEHSARTICRYNIADQSMTVAHETATRLGLPVVLQGVPYAQMEDDSISSDTANNYLAFFEGILHGKKESSCVYCRKLNNRWRWLSARATSIFDLSGKPVSAIISFTDITEEQEKELIYKKWKLSLTVKKPEQYTLFRCNLNKDSSYDTKEGALFGYAVDSTVHRQFNECTEEFCNQYVMEDDRSKYTEFLDSDRMLAGYHRGVRSGEFIFRAKLGEADIRWIRLSLELLEYPDSTDVEAYMMYEDINDSVLEELQIKRQAETDSLTGLQNRKIFIEHVNSLIAQEGKDSCRALFLLDIDYFKHINDTFGHGVGDESIVSMADIILSVIGKAGVVCRLGGDEFLVYLPDMPSRDAVAEKARELCEAAHITIKSDIQVSVSIGVALVTDKGENFDSMYHKSDKALYHVKGHGRNNFAFYEPDMERGDNEVMSDALSGSLITLADGKNVMLVVDDSAINRMVTGVMFKNDFTIIEAENGQVALDYLREHSDEVAIVLLDIMMPVMDGYGLLAAMKDDPLLQKIPVIVISGEDDRKASLRAIQAGASEYIVKPVDAELLRLRVSSALSKSENGRLRKQNNDYAVDSQELRSYRSLMDSNATVLIEYSAKIGVFKYAPKTGAYLNGTFDTRPLWQILAEDNIASDADVETIRKMLTESEKPCKAMFDLMTPDGAEHPFLMKVMLRNITENDDVVLITLTDRK